MAERYLRAAPGRTVRVPIVALACRAGDAVPVDQVREWGRLTSDNFTLREVPDANLSLRPTAAALLAFLDVWSPAWRPEAPAVKG
jgi:hypothetical protein